MLTKKVVDVLIANNGRVNVNFQEEVKLEKRGLLCGNCNTAIGKLKENLEVISKVLTYLEENGDVYS